MRIIFSLLFLLTITAVNAQQCIDMREHIADSVIVTGIMVKSGIIYKYDEIGFRYARPSPVVSIYTDADSAFHFEEGTVRAVFKIDDFFVVCINNERDEFITYSNLRSTPYKKGDVLQNGSLIGEIHKDEDGDGNYLDVLISTGRTAGQMQKMQRERPSKNGSAYSHTTLSYGECTKYIVDKMNHECGSNRATLL